MARSYPSETGPFLARRPTLWALAALAAACSGPVVDDGGDERFAAARASARSLYLSATGPAHRSGATGEFYFPEIAGSGGAFLDYDADGDLDLYVVQSGSVEAALGDPGGQGESGADRLYRTDFARGEGSRRSIEIVDVTERAGVRAHGYGMGVAVGDVDDDGFPDLYVTNAGPNQLWRNRGDGTFVDVTDAAGVAGDRWSTSASFFDADADGDLDLYVANYVDFRLETHRDCRARSGALDYCGPLSYNPEPDRLYRNRGDGTFEDVSDASGIGSVRGNGLGVVAADFDTDGWVDVFVANDQMVNFLWMNRGDGTFAEEAALAGCAVNMEGDEEASMGVVAADFDEDGALDLFMTHLAGETHTLYRGDGEGLFEDRTAPLGLASPTLAATGFGVEAIDFDGDGWQDVFVANGAVYAIESQRLEGDPRPFRQVDQLFWSDRGVFREIEEPFLRDVELPRIEAGRGVASGDRLRVGSRLLLVFNNDGPLHQIDALTVPEGGWLGVEALTASGRPAIGASVAVEPGVIEAGAAEGPAWRHRRVHRDGSYCSSRDPSVLVGLGSRGAARLRVTWPDGESIELRRPPEGRYLRFVR